MSAFGECVSWVAGIQAPQPSGLSVDPPLSLVVVQGRSEQNCNAWQDLAEFFSDSVIERTCSVSKVWLL